MRLINVLIDLLIIYVLFMSGLLINASIHKPSDEQLTPLVVGGMLLLLTLFYYFVFEYITKRTPAKWITGTKVITKRGTSPTLKQILIRTLTRFLPIQIWLLFRNKRMYLHDKWSHTMVITAD